MGMTAMCISSFSNTSHSEPNIATVFWRRSRRKVIAEQRTASSRFFLLLLAWIIFDEKKITTNYIDTTTFCLFFSFLFSFFCVWSNNLFLE